MRSPDTRRPTRGRLYHVESTSQHKFGEFGENYLEESEPLWQWFVRTSE